MPSLSRKLDYNEPCFEEKNQYCFSFSKRVQQLVQNLNESEGVKN
jgi:hypothetical protein